MKASTNQNEDFSFLNSVFFKQSPASISTNSNLQSHLGVQETQNCVTQVDAQQTHRQFQSQEFYCLSCKKQYKNKKTFNSHVQTQHNSTKPFTCPICQKGFKRSDYLLKHKDSHKEEREFQCQQCEQKLKTRLTLEKHVKTVHEKEIIGWCNCCNKGFARKDYLKKHLQRGEQKHECGQCMKRFSSKQSMQIHYMNKHLQ